MLNEQEIQQLRQQLQVLTAQVAEPALAAKWRSFYQLELNTLPCPVTNHFACIDAVGFRLAVQTYVPEQPVGTVFILHGYFDHMGLYGHAIRWALSENLAVVCMDLPGHGLSSGERAGIDSFQQYTDALVQLLANQYVQSLPQPWHVLAQSTGCSVIMDYLLANPFGDEFDKIMLLAPLIRPCAWGRSKTAFHMLRSVMTRIKRVFSNNSHDQQFLDFLKNDPLQPLEIPTTWVGALNQWLAKVENAQKGHRPVILVQGGGDTTVDWQHNIPFVAHWFDLEAQLFLPMAKHHLVNETVNYRDEIFGFLSQQLPR